MESFIIACKAVWPFLCYMIIGRLLVQFKKADEAFLRKLNQVAFITLFPMNIFKSIYQINEGSNLSRGFIELMIIVEAAVLIILLWVVPKLIHDRKKIPVIIQAIFRGNTLFFALPLAISVFGEEAGNMAAMMIAMIVPFYNVACVLLLSVYASDQRPRVKQLAGRIVTNPIILGAVAAMVMRLFPFRLSSAFMSPINTLGSAATPIAIIVLGGTLNVASAKSSWKILTYSLIVRFFVLPLIVLPLTFLLNLSGFERFLMIMLFITPVATASFPMSVNMGADGELAGEFVAVSTVASIGVLFVWILGLGTFGWL